MGWFKNPWAKGGPLSTPINSEALNSVFTSSEALAVSTRKVADEAEKLGDDELIMRSYRQLQLNEWNWFFSFNSSLAAAVKKPNALNSWEDYEKYKW